MCVCLWVCVVGWQAVVFRISFVFSLVLFQENQDRNGSVSGTNVEKQGIPFISLPVFHL